MKIRNYKDSDYKALHALYNRILSADRVTEEFFLEHLILTPNFDPEGVFLAEDDQGELVGAVVAQVVNRSINPYGPDQVVSARDVGNMMPPLFTDKEVGKALIGKAEEFFRSRGKVLVKVVSFGPTLFPDALDKEAYSLIAETLEECCYSSIGRHYSMGRSLFNYAPSEKIREKIRIAAEKGIYAKVCEFSDVEAVKRFMEEGGLAGRIQNLVQKIRADELDQVIIIRNDEEVLGYCQYKYYDETERVGPFGVTQKMRGQGLGQVMTAKLLEVMASRGYQYAYFASCSEGNTHFYGKNDFKIFRTKDIYTKNI